MALFRSIDRDHDGRVNKDELREACRNAGLTVSMRRFDGFFDELDMNHDGFISFDEFRSVT
jgi:solute carrier family 25 (mitochondrial phosphate transporter), member 23/24/25/41